MASLFGRIFGGSRTDTGAEPLGGIDPDLCIFSREGVSAAERIPVCNRLLEQGDPKLKARFFNGRASAYEKLGDTEKARGFR